MPAMKPFDFALVQQDAACRAYRALNARVRNLVLLNQISKPEFYMLRDRNDRAFYRRCDQIAKNWNVYLNVNRTEKSY